MFVNVWLALRDTAETAILTRLRHNEERDGNYTGPVTDRQHALFRMMADQENVRRIFRPATIGGNIWKLWSISFDEPARVLQTVAAELAQLTTDFPTMVAVAGAWRRDGRQVGTQHVFSTRSVTRDVSFFNPNFQPDSELPNFDDRRVLRESRTFDEEFISGKTGTPTYAVHPMVLRFLPDVDDVGTRPTEPTDDRTNLLMGQASRSFH